MVDYRKLFDKKETLATQNSIISEIVKIFADYDVTDILTKIGNLYLSPENASHSIRLDALLFATVQNKYQADKPKITNNHFHRIISKYFGTSDRFSYFEDPCENMFTEAFTFFNGSYVVFPGIKESSTYILRNICKAIYLVEENQINEEIKSHIASLILVVLTLSNLVASKAKLTRCIEPSQKTADTEIYFPNP
jgi:hypothetical protein